MEIVAINNEIASKFIRIVTERILFPYNLYLDNNSLIYKTAELKSTNSAGIFITMNFRKTLDFAGLGSLFPIFDPDNKNKTVDNLFLFELICNSPKFNREVFELHSFYPVKQEGKLDDPAVKTLYVKFMRYVKNDLNGTAVRNYIYPYNKYIQLKTIENNFESIRNLYDAYLKMLNKYQITSVPNELTPANVRMIIKEAAEETDDFLKSFIKNFLKYINIVEGTVEVDAYATYVSIADLRQDLYYYYRYKFKYVS